jgi:hypothetical protein
MASDQRTSRPIRVHRGETKRGFWITVTTSDWRVIRAVERAVRSTGLPVEEFGPEVQPRAGEATDASDHVAPPLAQLHQEGAAPETRRT